MLALEGFNLLLRFAFPVLPVKQQLEPKKSVLGMNLINLLLRFAVPPMPITPKYIVGAMKIIKLSLSVAFPSLACGAGATTHKISVSDRTKLPVIKAVAITHKSVGGDPYYLVINRLLTFSECQFSPFFGEIVWLFQSQCLLQEFNANWTHLSFVHFLPPVLKNPCCDQRGPVLIFFVALTPPDRVVQPQLWAFP